MVLPVVRSRLDLAKRRLDGIDKKLGRSIARFLFIVPQQGIDLATRRQGLPQQDRSGLPAVVFPGIDIPFQSSKPSPQLLDIAVGANHSTMLNVIGCGGNRLPNRIGLALWRGIA